MTLVLKYKVIFVVVKINGADQQAYKEFLTSKNKKIKTSKEQYTLH